MAELFLENGNRVYAIEPNPDMRRAARPFTASRISNPSPEVKLGSDPGNMTIGLGPEKYPGNLTHWTNNTWYLSFPNPDDQVGYFTFTENTPGAVTGFTSEEFGRFTRV